MKQYVIASFYKFVPLTDYQTMKMPLLDLMRKYQLLGTIILSKEGINGSFAGIPANMSHLYDALKIDPRLMDLNFKESYDDMMPFEKAKVKFRNEIVSLGISEIDPLKSTGQRVSPLEWNQLISDQETILIDTRNTYEYDLGSFKYAIDPNTENFRDFPNYVRDNLLDKKTKKIAMFCTGGIRCEKSSSYLLSLGFEKVYQLDGGIINYMNTVPTAESMWEGKCFVFDERVAIDQTALVTI